MATFGITNLVDQPSSSSALAAFSSNAAADDHSWILVDDFEHVSLDELEARINLCFELERSIEEDRNFLFANQEEEVPSTTHNQSGCVSLPSFKNPFSKAKEAREMEVHQVPSPSPFVYRPFDENFEDEAVAQKFYLELEKLINEDHEDAATSSPDDEEIVYQPKLLQH